MNNRNKNNIGYIMQVKIFLALKNPMDSQSIPL